MNFKILFFGAKRRISIFLCWLNWRDLNTYEKIIYYITSYYLYFFMSDFLIDNIYFYDFHSLTGNQSCRSSLDLLRLTSNQKGLSSCMYWFVQLTRSSEAARFHYNLAFPWKKFLSFSIKKNYRRQYLAFGPKLGKSESILLTFWVWLSVKYWCSLEN